MLTFKHALLGVLALLWAYPVAAQLRDPPPPAQAVYTYPAPWLQDGATAPLAVTSVTANVVLPWVAALAGTDRTLASPVTYVCNIGTVNAYVKFGTSNAVAATTSDILVLANGPCSILSTGNTNKYIAAITATGTTSLTIANGNGTPVVGGSGSAGGGATTTLSNVVLPTARYNLGVGNFASPYDYDKLCDGSTTNASFVAGTAHSCSAAINTAAAITAAGSGIQVDVHLQAGNYYMTSQVNITRGQILYGDGRGNTNLLMDQAFAPAATAVVKMTPGGVDQGPQVRELNFFFAQPSDQGTRANFAVMGSCTSGLGGTGCKYPPAIITQGTPAGRNMVQNVRIAGGWDGINSAGVNAVWFIDNLECGTLNICLNMGGTLDGSHIKGFQFWPFALNAGVIYTGVYSDGLNFAAKFGEMDSLNVEDWTDFKGRVQINDPRFWGSFSNVSMDGGNATFEIIQNNWTLISNIYSTSVSDGVNDTSCQIDIGASSRSTLISNWQSEGPGTGTIGALCVAGGNTQVTNSWIKGNKADLTSVVLTGGTLNISNSGFIYGNGWTVPVVSQTTGALVMTGNYFPTTGTNVGSIKINTDVVGNYISNNRLKSWPLVFNSFPTTSVLGYYDLGDQAFTLTLTPAFATLGDYAATSVVSTGSFFLRGNYMDFYTDTSWTNNAYTTASGNFQLVSNMPKTIIDAGCSLFLMNNFTTTFTPGCGISNTSTNAYVRFAGVSTGTSATVYSTTQSPASKAAMEVRLSGRYPIR